MEMLLCGRIRNGREGMQETLKDTVGVQTPGLAQAERLQVMTEVRLPRWVVAEAETCHPLVLLWHSEKEGPWLYTGRCYSRHEHSPQNRGWTQRLRLQDLSVASTRCAALTEPYVPSQTWKSPPF